MAGVRSRARHPYATNFEPGGGDKLPRPARTGQSAHQRGGRRARRRSARRRGSRGSRGCRRRGARLSARGPRYVQDQHGLRRPANDQRHHRVQGPYGEGRQSGDRELAQGRRDRDRPDQCAAVQRPVFHVQRAPRPHAQSMGCGPDPRWLDRWRRRRGGDRDRTARPRQRPRWLGAISSLCLWRPWIASDNRAHSNLQRHRARGCVAGHSAHSHAGTVGPLGPRSPAGLCRDGDRRSSRPVVDSGGHCEPGPGAPWCGRPVHRESRSRNGSSDLGGATRRRRVAGGRRLPGRASRAPALRRNSAAVLHADPQRGTVQHDKRDRASGR